MTIRTRTKTLAAPAVFGVARIALGVLWIHEGIFKYSAHFGRADILLVADGVKSNNRVPWYFVDFADSILRHVPTLFGFVVPLVETGIGVALVLGILTLPVAVISLLQLMTYWSSDQLIAQYPVMAALSAIVIAFPVISARFSASSVIIRALDERAWSRHLVDGPLRRWL